MASGVRRGLVGLVSALMLLGGISAAPPALGAPDRSEVIAAVFGGVSGSTAKVGETLYAKAGAKLELTVTTSSDTKCVDVKGAFPGHASSTVGRGVWTFASPVLGSGDGVRTVTVTASPSFNSSDNCNGNSGSLSVSYVLDNTGPIVTGALTPAPNAAGWNTSDTTVSWKATDSGVGVAATQPFRTETITTDMDATTTAPAQEDRLGNVGAEGSVTVRVDKTAPGITATQASAGYGHPTTVTFTCTDATSGISSCLADGSMTNAKTISGNGTVTGTATDRAGNTKTLSVPVVNVDTTAPVLSGSPVATPVGGWYRDDVTVRWTASDPESGIPTPPADTTIEGEGTGLTSTTSVANGAGLSTTATSSPPVKIDRTAPTTAVTGGSNNWTNQNVTLDLVASDNLSGIVTTTYSIDGGTELQGSSVALETEGEHTVRFFSTDRAGNVEATRTVEVRIDKTAPTISHRFTAPDAYVGGWTNQNVTVTFDCQDQGGSEVASCTEPVVVDTEGALQPVSGTATDGAGNSSTDMAVVSVDKTAPTIGAVADRKANGEGWYNADVTVSFIATDALSGIQLAPASQVLGEGRDQSATGTATDAAGNSAQVSLGGINVDKTAPKLTAAAPIGWQRGDVTVTWDCTDALSGVKSGPADSLVKGEGANLAASATCADKAGNATTETVTGIRIDRTAPTTAATVPAPLQSGWYGAPVDVTINSSDNLSGVGRTFYRIDGGPDQTYDGPFEVADEGIHTVEFWSEDIAGNVEGAGAPITLRIDRTAPSTTVINPISPATGWHVTSGIPFAFDAGDGEMGSGVAATFYTIDGEQHTYGEPFTKDLSTGVHKVTYWSVDQAGNVEVAREFIVQIDTMGPTVTPGDVVETTWRNTDLSQEFQASDGLSGLKNEADSTFTLTVSAESKDENTPTTATKTVYDVAGNSTVRVVSALIDKTAPTGVSINGGPQAGVKYFPNNVPQPTCAAVDALSGLADCVVSGYSTAVGTHTLTATATDKAGNETTVTGPSYTVRKLTLTGFYAPVDKGIFNTVKGGATVPLKFEVFDQGVEAASTSVVKSFTTKTVSCTSSTSEDPVEELASLAGTNLRYDTTGGQFIQNWQTPKKAGTCYEVRMTTVDDSYISATFKLK